MLYQLGKGLRAHGRGQAAQVSAKTFDFMGGTLPSEFTYTRADTVSTVRNSVGKWVAVASNAPRFDFDASGNALGLRIEPPRTNKCTNVNVNPTATTNLTKGGDAASVLSVVNDPSGLLVAAKLDALCTNGKLFYLDNSAGTTTAYVDIGGEVGNLNPHSVSVWVAGTQSGYNGTMTLVGATNSVQINGTALTRLVLENETPTHITRTIRINVTNGRGVYFILNQLEEGPFCTSPILTNGAATSRAREVCVATGLNALGWFNNDAGAIVGEFMFDRVTGFDTQYAFLANEGTGLTNALGVYLNNNAASQARVRDIIASTNYQNDDVHRPQPNTRFPCAVAWKNGESYAVAGPCRYNFAARSGGPTNMDRIYLGGRPFNGAMSGWVRSLKVYNVFRSVEQLGPDMIPATAKAVISGGQSNKHGFFRSTVGQLNSGAVNARAQMNQYWTTTENWLINGAQDGSAAIRANDVTDANWWYDPATATFGPRMAYWESVAKAFGTAKIQAIDWDQGESDSVSSVADLKAAWLAIFGRMRSVVGNKPVIITPIGRRGDSQNTNYNNLRQAQRELDNENTWISRAPEKFIRPLADVVHMTDTAYGDHGTVLMRKILSVLGESISGGVDGPTITGAVRSGTTVTVTLSHGGGSDFTPTSGIAGFKFFGNGAEIAVSSAVRTNATTITLTLASAPSGVEVLYYGYGTLIEATSTYTSLVRDNSTYQLPLRAAAVTL